MKRAARALVVLAALNALLSASSCPPITKPGDPLRGLTAEELDRFNRGRAAFQRVFTPETGLGPLFNANACAECHEDPAVGGIGDEIELHVSLLRTDGFCDPLADKGGPVMQLKATPALVALGIEREPVPDGASRASRTSPSVLGFGLLDAVPEETILKLADPHDSNHDGISGRPNRFFDGRMGRFGRKAIVPTLAEFNEGAYPIELSVTTQNFLTEQTIGPQPVPPGTDPVAEPELAPADVALTDDFVRFSAPPMAMPLDREGERGKIIFGTVGCGSCHTPSLTTGDHPVRALRFKKVEAYTDLLLHDMGAERSDICLGLATPSEFRTEPLMGLRFKKALLHDGAATTIEQAIEMHGGEAAGARDRFRRLTAGERAALIKFLGSL